MVNSNLPIYHKEVAETYWCFSMCFVFSHLGDIISKLICQNTMFVSYFLELIIRLKLQSVIL